MGPHHRSAFSPSQDAIEWIKSAPAVKQRKRMSIVEVTRPCPPNLMPLAKPHSASALESIVFELSLDYIGEDAAFLSPYRCTDQPLVGPLEPRKAVLGLAMRKPREAAPGQMANGKWPFCKDPILT